MVRFVGIDLWKFELSLFLVSIVVLLIVMRMVNWARLWPGRFWAGAVLLEILVLAVGYVYWVYWLVQWD